MFCLTANFIFYNSHTVEFCYFSVSVNATCSVSRKPANGTFNVAACNRSISFSCDEGFDLIGQELITCHNGSWSHGVPMCKVHVRTTTTPTTTIGTTQTPNFVEEEQPNGPTDFAGDVPKCNSIFLNV